MLTKERAVMEAAIKTLELSLHENTSDQETLAAVMAFRRKARGQPLSEIAKTIFGGRYDGRTLPEYRQEWAYKFDQMTTEVQSLTTQVRDLARSKNELQILLAKAVAEQQAATSAKLRAETRVKEVKNEAKQTERAAHAMVRASTKIKPTPETPKRNPRSSCPAPVFMRPSHDTSPRKGEAWADEHRTYLISLYQGNPDQPNKLLRDRLNEQFNTHRSENAIRGELNRLRDQGLLEKYRPGRERKKAA